jgi:ketosteroid isomerase-like protein
VAAGDLEIARRFRVALETAVRTGDSEPVLGLLAADIEWVTPQRTLRGIDELRAWRVWGSRNEGGFDFEFGEGDWIDEGDGHVVCDVHQVYRLKGVEEPAYERDRRIELTIRAGQVARYEVRIVG